MTDDGTTRCSWPPCGPSGLRAPSSCDPSHHPRSGVAPRSARAGLPAGRPWGADVPSARRQILSTGGSSNPDVVLVGGGIMSATLAALLGIVAPDWTVEVFESGTAVAEESSGPWNNAGTGHSALCELNYTPARPDGSVDPAKAVGINEQFQVSRQFWSHLVRAGLTDSPKTFITSVPHIS